MPSRFFVDETDLALGRKLAETLDGIVHPGHPDLPEVPRQTPDEVWLQVVGREGLVVITRDKRIRWRSVERSAWVNHGVRGFVLTGRASQTTVGSIQVIEKHWAEIERFVTQAFRGPWMYALTKDGVREISLE